MDELPDDVVVQVLSLLDVGDVLRSRLVCRRLSGLALHADVWRRRRLESYSDWPASLRKAVLRVAPCLRYLDFCTGSWCDAELRQLMGRTDCAAEEIDVFLQHDDCVALVRNQLANGRVRRINLKMYRRADKWDPDVFDLVREVLAAPDLAELSVRGDCPAPAGLRTVLPAELAPPPSLKKLTLDRAEPNTFPSVCVDVLLRAHAPTLEEVVFTKSNRVPSPAGTAALAGAARLRALSCPGWPGLAELPADGPLRSLILEGGVGPSAKDFLRSADRLERLELCDQDAEWVQGAVEAAASSGWSALRELAVGPRYELGDISSGCDGRRVDLSSLRLALPSLRHLTSLTVTFEPRCEGFYASLRARAVPHLKSLHVNLWYRQCAHAWLHGMLGLLEELPELRIVAGSANRCGDRLMLGPSPASARCAFCQRRCHVPLPGAHKSARDSRVAHHKLCCSYRVTCPSDPALLVYSWFEVVQPLALPPTT